MNGMNEVATCSRLRATLGFWYFWTSFCQDRAGGVADDAAGVFVAAVIKAPERVTGQHSTTACYTAAGIVLPMSRSKRRFDWMWIGLPAVVLGVLVVYLGRGTGVPSSGGTVFYPAVMLYNYAAIQLAIVILLAASLLLVLWLPQALRRLPRFAWNGLALGLALLGAALACWGSLPRALLVSNYVHLDRAVLDGRVYQLGARVALDGDNYYVLCDCAQPGFLCRCRRLTEAGELAFTERPALVADPAAGTLALQVGAQTVVVLDP